jgi:hypothetical protein
MRTSAAGFGAGPGGMAAGMPGERRRDEAGAGRDRACGHGCYGACTDPPAAEFHES